MRVIRFAIWLAALSPFTTALSCGGSTDSDGMDDAGNDSAPNDVVGDPHPQDAAPEGDVHVDESTESSTDDADAPNDAEADCGCPPTPPLHGQPCCAPPTLNCAYCDATKKELTSASCKAGKWSAITQWDTPCGDN